MDRRLLALLMVVVMMSPLTGSIAASSSASEREWMRLGEAQIVGPGHLTSVPEQSDIWWDPHSKWWEVTTLDMDRNGIHDSIQEAVGAVNVGLSFTRAVTDSDRQSLLSMGFEIRQELPVVDAVLLGDIDPTEASGLSQMDGGAMLAWRATLAGMVFLLIGLNKRRGSMDISKRIFSKSFVPLIICQIANTSFFAFAISLAPVAIVLVAVATVPIISVILSALFLGERASLRSWGIILTVMLGIVISVFGDLHDDIDFNVQTVMGALLGLAVAFSLAINFIVVRQDRTVEFELALGIGALIAGLTAFALSSTATNVTLSSALIISLTGLIILPVSFVMLSRASRYTTASNVGMLMLLETVLGPLWVWMIIDERPSHLTIAGGAIVILAIFYFILSERKNATPV